MAISGSRGRSRGGGRGRGLSYGGLRGSSRGGGRGRGRGGAGTSRGGRGRGKPVFDSARLAQKEAEEKGLESEAASEEVDEGAEEDASSDESDDEPAAEETGYQKLMHQLEAAKQDKVTRKKKRHVFFQNVPGQLEVRQESIESVPQVKRRKIQHNPEPDDNLGQDEITADDVDEVDEPEEGPDTSVNGDAADEGNGEDLSDPFEAQFADPDDNLLSKRLSGLQHNNWTRRKIIHPNLGKIEIIVPKTEDLTSFDHAPISGPQDLKLKQKLAGVMQKSRPSFDELERSLAPLVFGYEDVLFCERTLLNSENLRRLACLHAVNHILKTRDRVIKNNSRLAREESDDLELRDQGFTRPKVLMILPNRGSCVRMVNIITALCEPEQQENRKRFDDSYVEKSEMSQDKPEDFRDLFAGSDDDLFRLGLKFTRKAVKYFSQFYNSDIILASPLGLRLAIEGKEDKKGDYDFLSSIEIAIVDQADAITMQNWEHMEFIFEHLNLPPVALHGCDISRVRQWYFDDQAKNFRQTITFSSFNTTEINGLLLSHSKNWRGGVKITQAVYPSAMQFGIKIKQTFSRFDALTPEDAVDTRLNYFTNVIIPTLTRRAKDTTGTLIFLPSYVDYLQVRNYFVKSTELSFGSISEYNTPSEVSRARSHFLTGRHCVILYTERAHHFKRYRIKGVKKVIMYGLPENPTFYKEIAGEYLRRTVQEQKLAPNEGNVRVMFCKHDAMKLERIVGTERYGRMIAEKGDTFDFL